MFRNVLAGALRNLQRNPLYGAISIASLAIGFATVILTGLYVRDELDFDRFVPNHRNIHVVTSEFTLGVTHLVMAGAPAYMGPLIAGDFPDAKVVARLGGSRIGVRNGQVSALEPVAFADPDFFSILRLPVLAGDPVATMHRPDGVVITRAMARKYFGRDAPIGERLELEGGAPLHVGGVLKDLPATTNLNFGVFAPTLNARSYMGPAQSAPPVRGSPYNSCCQVYVQVADKAAAQRIRSGLHDFVVRRITLPNGRLRRGATIKLDLVPLAELHLAPLNIRDVDTPPQASRAMLAALSLIAALVFVVGAVNFVNLMTARAARRAVEVGVRKTVGARHFDLVLQFVGEAVGYTLAAFVVAVAGVELLLPPLRVALDRPMHLDYWREPQGLAISLAAALVLGLLTGLYPALVQSRFRPAVALKGGPIAAPGSAPVRSVLTVLQFAALIGLVVAAAIIQQQTRFALNEGLGLDKTRMVIMNTWRPDGATAAKGPRALCRDAFPDQVRRLPGVAGAACGSSGALDLGESSTSVTLPDGRRDAIVRSAVDFGFLELYGIKPLAGRFFSKAHPEDDTPLTGPFPYPPKTAVINEMAMQVLGFRSPGQAVGKTINATNLGTGPVMIQIVGVTPNFAFDLVDHGKRPRYYYVDRSLLDNLNIKLTGREVEGTLKAIDRLWWATGAFRPPSRRLADDYARAFYVDSLREGWLMTGLAAVAVVLAALGLFGLAAFTAEQRTKEIGVRKALGASTAQMVGLLTAAFARPVLWANLIAWPLAWWGLHRWLLGFARHIALSPWMFVAAGAAALVVALATVAAHVLKVARDNPVAALRYE